MSEEKQEEKEDLGKSLFPKYKVSVDENPLESKINITFKSHDGKGNEFEDTVEHDGDQSTMTKEIGAKMAKEYGIKAKAFFDSLLPIRFEVITGNTQFEFEDAIATYVENGWEVQGGMSISPEGLFCILMFKENKKDGK